MCNSNQIDFDRLKDYLKCEIPDSRTDFDNTFSVEKNHYMILFV